MDDTFSGQVYVRIVVFALEALQISRHGTEIALFPFQPDYAEINGFASLAQPQHQDSLPWAHHATCYIPGRSAGHHDIAIPRFTFLSLDLRSACKPS